MRSMYQPSVTAVSAPCFAPASGYEFTCQLATLEPPSPDMQQVFGAMHGNQKAMDGFVQVNAGTISPAEFFSSENIGAIMAAARRTT
jgi:hypothetical protein